MKLLPSPSADVNALTGSISVLTETHAHRINMAAETKCWVFLFIEKEAFTALMHEHFTSERGRFNLNAKKQRAAEFTTCPLFS